MKKPKQINFILDVPPYPAEIMVSIGQTDDELIQAVKRWPKLLPMRKNQFIESIKTNDPETHYGECHHIDGTGKIILHIYGPIKTANDHGNLSHEIFHAVEMIERYVGLDHFRESSEAFAYLISFITESIYKKL